MKQKQANTPVDMQGSNTGQHTPGKLDVNYLLNENGDLAITTAESDEVVAIINPTGEDGKYSIGDEEDAYRIVECWNGYDTAVKELHWMAERDAKKEKEIEGLKQANRELLEALKGIMGNRIVNKHTTEQGMKRYNDALDKANEALSKHNK